MKKQIRKPLDSYQAVIFDMDGTLYFQQPLRLHMCLKMLACLSRPSRWKEICLVYHYRKLREKWSFHEEFPGQNTNINETKKTIEQLQYEAAAKKAGTTPAYAKRIISFWLREAPLSLLSHYRDETMAELFDVLKEKSIKRIIYSDYPAEDKLAALSLRSEGCFSSEQKEINSMKPNPRGLNFILEQLELSKDSVLMIGDRFSKDGKAAMAAGTDFLIVSSLPPVRKRQLKLLLSLNP